MEMGIDVSKANVPRYFKKAIYVQGKADSLILISVEGRMPGQ